MWRIVVYVACWPQWKHDGHQGMEINLYLCCQSLVKHDSIEVDALFECTEVYEI